MVGVERIELSTSRSRTEHSTDELHPDGCPQQESNLHLRFRKPLLYPLSYEDSMVIIRQICHIVMILGWNLQINISALDHELMIKLSKL